MAATAAAARRRRVRGSRRRRPLGVDLAKAAAGRRARSSSAFLAAAQERAAGSMAPPRLAVGRSRGGGARHRPGQGGGREEGMLVLGVLGGGLETPGIEGARGHHCHAHAGSVLWQSKDCGYPRPSTSSRQKYDLVMSLLESMPTNDNWGKKPQRRLGH
ncbi:hypothetical protein OsJ_07053 [Oryza sativa Japonica Group]|uniref:Uncharacterized protein n=1 Tax=Oryza sativa subsp. japonica TaxID=39947 RepID=A3A7R8_ORYSJ|nr:hypothetical protein OsJ_07053 [Oryza sativa Japonica Group]